MPPELHFLRPQWFLALAPLLLLLLGLWRSEGTANAWRGLVDVHLLPHLLVGEAGRPRRLPLILLALAWLIGAIALAGPVYERLLQPVFSTTTKRVILLDLSPSMNATDVAPSRLARARFEVLDLLNATHEGQVALIAFGPEPFIVSPLTGDARTIADQVQRLATDLLPIQGPRHTDRALAMAGDLLTQAGGGGGEAILITDGVGDDSGAGQRADAAARALAAQGDRLSVLGVGTTQGAPVPGADGGFAAGRGGAIAMSRLERGALERLARAGNGRYVDFDPGERDTKSLIAGSPRAATTGTGMVEQKGLVADQWREEGPWLLLVLLPIAALAFRRGWWLPVLALALVLPPSPGWAFGWDDLWQRPDQQAASRLAAGDAAAAAARFQDRDWRAAARYRSGDYAAAVADLAGARGPDADYNRANALARQGRLDEAIAGYEQALKQAPDDADARANLELVKQLRDQKKQDERKDQPGDQGQQGQQGQDKKDQKDQKDQEDQKGKQSQDGQKDQKDQNDQGGKQNQGGGADQQTSGADQSGAQGQDQQTGKGAPPESKPKPESGGKTADGKQAKDSDKDKDTQNAQGSAAGQTGKAPPPKPGDLGQQEPAIDLPDAKPSADQPAGPTGPAKEGKPDDRPPTDKAASAGTADLSPEQREQQQAMEAQLRRVPDDPAGLLRQRFLLQQLRREGRLQ
ncbi:VWA domain-containing protein [uncultured Thiodictyon sp.]|uniref:VWA domain-containing protein n=1 Tax=uncultured Thiodictyon sp. TaxID=1846217 RepID=UPI0025DE7201|nr:VWA domain-containing protein [uncultured Thiodictyon sp.]